MTVFVQHPREQYAASDVFIYPLLINSNLQLGPFLVGPTAVGFCHASEVRQTPALVSAISYSDKP